MRTLCLAVALFFYASGARASEVSNFEFGMQLGTPAGLNFSVGRWGELLTRLSGGFWGDRVRGFQADIGYTFDHEGSFWQYFGLTYTNSRLDYYKEWEAVGPSYGFNASGFQLQVGLTFGSGYFSSPQGILQLGYSFIFRD